MFFFCGWVDGGLDFCCDRFKYNCEFVCVCVVSLQCLNLKKSIQVAKRGNSPSR